MNAQQLKNAILQEAIEGRLVPQDPNDEPASVLLERIRKEKEHLVKEGKLKKKDLEVKPISEDEIPFEIPESWEWCRLGDITEIKSSKRVFEKDYVATGIPFFRSKEIGDLSRGEHIHTELYITKEHYNELKEKYGVPQKGDILLTSVGSIGNFWICDGREFYYKDGNVTQICANDNIKSRYITLFLSSKLFSIQTNTSVSGTAYNALTIIKLKSLLFPLPPLTEQKRIVAKIEEVLPKVEKYGKVQDELNKLNEELPERLKKSILQEAIEGRLVPQDPNDEPASVLLDKIRAEKKQLVKEGKLKKKDLEETPISEDEKPFEIPESWEWVRLGEISTYANTKKKINAAQADSNLWGLDLEDIEKGGRLLCLKSVGERKAIGDKTYFSEGDILYSKLRPYLLKILIAPKNGICTPEIIPFTCYGCISKEFVVNLLKSAYVDDYINSVTFGVKMPRVSTETMVSLVIPLPPLAEQHRIVEKIEEVFKEIDKLKK